MTKQRCQFFGIVTCRRLDLIPEPYRSLFAMWRCADAKRANKPRRDRDLLNRKLRDIERLKRDLARGGPKRITHTGELACECRWCSVQKPILQFPWKGEGYGFRAECTTCYREFIAAARKRSRTRNVRPNAVARTSSSARGNSRARPALPAATPTLSATTRAGTAPAATSHGCANRVTTASTPASAPAPPPASTIAIPLTSRAPHRRRAT